MRLAPLGHFAVALALAVLKPAPPHLRYKSADVAGAAVTNRPLAPLPGTSVLYFEATVRCWRRCAAWLA